MTKQELFDRNIKIVNEVMGKIERICPNSVDMVAIGGSFASGDYYEKSDLDLVIIRNDEEAKKIHKSFIMDDIGYDIYTQSWDDIKKMSRYRNPYVSELKQLDILYTRNSEARDKYKEYQAELNDNMNNKLLIKHNVSNIFSKVLNSYSELLNANTLKDSYKTLGNFIKNSEDIVYLLNGKYVEHGIKGIPIEILKMKDLPNNFIKNYNKLFDCNSKEDILEIIIEMTNDLETYLIGKNIDIKSKNPITKRTNEKKEITFNELTGTFEELYSNYYNKLKYAYENNDKFLSFRTLIEAQNYYDFISDNYNIDEIDIISKYNPNNLKQNFDVFVNSLKLWKSLYDEKNKKIEIVTKPNEIYDNEKVFRVFDVDEEKKFIDKLNKEGDESISVSTTIKSMPILNYTIEEAAEFSKDNRLDQWVQYFLRNNDKENANPNLLLANGLKKEERFYYGPVEVSLDKIIPVRTDEELLGNELNYYNKVVDRMSNDFNGENFPPLLLEYRDNKFYLTDGNHRFSALKKLGINKYYSIIWGNKNLENNMLNELNFKKGLKY